MDDKRIKLIDKKLYLCLIVATCFYLLGTYLSISGGTANGGSTRVIYAISFVILIASFIVGKFMHGYITAYLTSTCFVLSTACVTIMFNSCIVLTYLMVLLAIISIYQNSHLMIYCFIISFVSAFIVSVYGMKTYGWHDYEALLIPFILFTSIMAVTICFTQISKDNKMKYDELAKKQDEAEAAYENVKDLSKVVSQSATQLVEKATSNRDDTQLVLTSITEIVNALNSQNDSILSQAESSNSIQTKLEDVQSCVYDMNQQVDSVIDITSKNESNMQTLNQNTVIVNEMAQNSQSSIDELYKQVTEVQGVVDIITSVAEQTSLLSLNANIEAAKAGSFGAGFTVVAAEIRKLSESTTDSVQKINNMLNSLHSKTGKVNSQIQQMNSAFNQQKQEIEQTSDNIDELLNSMDLLRSGLSNVITSTDDVVASNNTVTESITNLSSISEEISATIDTVGTACEGVLNSSNDTLSIAKDVDDKTKELSL